MDRDLPPGFQKATLFLLQELVIIPTVMMNFGRKIPIVGTFANFLKTQLCLKGLFHPACLARVVSWFAFVVAIFMAHENGDRQRPAKRRHMQGMLDETDPLRGKSAEKRTFA